MAVVIGYFLAFANLIAVIMMTTDKLKIFIDFHSGLCVIGGTAISSVIAFGFKSLHHVCVIFVAAVKNKPAKIDAIINEIVKIAKETKGEVNQSFIGGYKSEFFFLKDGLALIADGFSKEQIESIMEERIDAVQGRYKGDERLIRALAKIPPSFGLMGTTVGLVALFAEVGGADSLKKIGPAMAVALTATLYGVLTAFLVFNPLLERIVAMTHHDNLSRQIILKGVLLLKQKSSPVYIEEMLKSHLSFKDQKKIGAQARAAA